jgi:hypothetical protein
MDRHLYWGQRTQYVCGYFSVSGRFIVELRSAFILFTSLFSSVKVCAIISAWMWYVPVAGTCSTGGDSFREKIEKKEVKLVNSHHVYRKINIPGIHNAHVGYVT